MEHQGEQEIDPHCQSDREDINKGFALSAVKQNDGKGDGGCQDEADLDDQENINAEDGNQKNGGFLIVPVELDDLFFLEDQTLDDQNDRADQDYNKTNAGDDSGTWRTGIIGGYLDLLRHDIQHISAEQSHENTRNQIGFNLDSSKTKSSIRIGIKTNLEAIPSLALGTEEISLIEMIQAYQTLANKGHKNEPYLIEKVEDQFGNILYEHKKNEELVLNESQVFILNELLTSTYQTEFIDYNYPTLISLAGKLSKKYAIKTGTTNTDRLIFGYNNDLLIGVWAGYDDNRETPSEDSQIPKNIWYETIEECLKDKEDNWYEIPNNVVGVLVNPITGELADDKTKQKKIFYYIKGTEPTYEDINLDILIPTIKEEN